MFLCCLKGPEGDKTVAMALAAPDQFVLKPQREGGGTIRETKILKPLPYLVPFLKPGEFEISVIS